MWNKIRKVKLKDILTGIGFRLAVQHKQVNDPIRYRLSLGYANLSNIKKLCVQLLTLYQTFKSNCHS